MHIKTKAEIVVATVMIFMVVVMLSLRIGEVWGIRETRQEAVQHGYGDYELNRITLKGEFRWNYQTNSYHY